MFFFENIVVFLTEDQYTFSGNNQGIALVRAVLLIISFSLRSFNLIIFVIILLLFFRCDVTEITVNLLCIL